MLVRMCWASKPRYKRRHFHSPPRVRRWRTLPQGSVNAIIVSGGSMNERSVSPEPGQPGHPGQDDQDVIPSRPTFIYRSFVHTDELDSLQLLRNSRFIVHVERATIAFCRTLGALWGVSVDENPDQFQMVREVQAKFAAPFRGMGEMMIHIWVERLGESSCVYGFICTSVEGKVVYARGTRAVVKLDPASLEPTSWSETFTRGHLPLL